MDKKELLKNLLQNMINDNQEGAKQDFHNYLTLKSQEVVGLNKQAPASAPAENQE